MKKINAQFDGKVFKPYSQEDLEAARSFKPNQIVRMDVFGVRKPRSVLQNKWIHAIFRLVAANTDDAKWDTPKKVKRRVKLAMKFFADDVIVSGNRVFFELRSFAFDEMDQDEANRVYDEAKEICASKLGVPPDVLEANARKEG
jgi:hypothetical protein